MSTLTTQTHDYGIVIAGHGSRDPEGVKEFQLLVELVRARSAGRPITYGFLEFARPTIDEAVRENVAAGSRQIVVVPGVLLAATHAKNDMPSEVLAMQKELPDVKLHYGTALHLHPLILKVCRERIIAAETQSSQIIKRSDTCLVMVGRGTTDPDANSDVSKLARILEEGLGFGASFVCYSGTAQPALYEGLEMAAKLGFRRIIVSPFFLFTGVLIKRIEAAIAELAARHPELEVLASSHIGGHEHVAEAFLERAAESISGKTSVNCSLCKYRTQIVGYEKEVGTPQQGHHFHVRASSSESPVPTPVPAPVPQPRTYTAHPIEVESFRIIEAGRDWSTFPELERAILQRLVHTSGDFDIVDDIFFSKGAAEAGLRALARRAPIVTDVTMVQSGLRRTLIEQFGLSVRCFVHDEETRLLADGAGITRSACGIRRAWMQYGNEAIVLIGDAPTAVEEAVRLVNEQQWRPHLIVGLPVGFVGTRECKERLRACLRVPRITNRGTRGGSPWAAAALNALLIRLANQG